MNQIKRHIICNNKLSKFIVDTVTKTVLKIKTNNVLYQLFRIIRIKNTSYNIKCCMRCYRYYSSFGSNERYILKAPGRA